MDTPSTLYSCHGFSSLQSPSAFPSLSSDDSSQQIEALRLGIEEKRLSPFDCGCGFEASFDVRQDGISSQNSLSQTSVASHEYFLQDGSFFSDSLAASMQPPNSEMSSELSSMLLTGYSHGVCLEDSYGFPLHTFNDSDTDVGINQTSFLDARQAHKTLVQIDQTPQVNPHDQLLHVTHAEIDQSPQANPHDLYGFQFSSSKVSSFVLPSSKQNAFNAINANSEYTFSWLTRLETESNKHK
ncbi:hypothetical protein L7F22_005049 [Adiantum nelumboides]|nr:hypothetical protein [Adiantum nelumboides]